MSVDRMKYLAGILLLSLGVFLLAYDLWYLDYYGRANPVPINLFGVVSTILGVALLWHSIVYRKGAQTDTPLRKRKGV